MDVSQYNNTIDPSALMGNPAQLAQDSGLYKNEDAVKLAKLYLEDNVPEDIKTNPLYAQMWAVLGKKIQLTFLEKDDVHDIESQYEMAKQLYIMSKSPQQLTHEDILSMNQIKMHLIASCKGAVGKGEKNERTMQNTQINQFNRSNVEGFQRQKRGIGGFLSNF